MSLERFTLAALTAAALSGLGCESATPPGPVPPGLDPVERRALMLWTVSDPLASLGPAAEDAVARLRPNGIVAGGDAASWLPEDPTAENPDTTSVLAWVAATSEATGVPLTQAVQAPLLPGEVTNACFDPSDPTADPAVAALSAGLTALLDQWPSLSDVLPAPAAASAYWDVSCTCTPCDSVDAAGMAARHELLWDVATEAIALRQRTAWWWHDAPDTPAQGAPESDPSLPRAAFDRALGDVDPQVSMLARAHRGDGGIWGVPDGARGESAVRRVASTLSAAGAEYGPTDALLLFGPDLYAQMREERADGVGAWFVEVDGGGRSALGSLEELDLTLIERTFRDSSASAQDVMLAAASERLGLTEEDARPLVRALRETGHTLALATHPLGLPILGLAEGTPAALPLAYGDPSAFDSAWTDRVEAMADPGLQEIVQVNQWATEAALGASLALTELNTAQELLSPADEALLRRRLKVLDYAARSWGRLALADVTLRAQEGLDDARVQGWLSDDADALDGLADEVEAALDSGAIVNAFPVIPANLRAVAAQVRLASGQASALARDFPVIYRQRHDFVDGRVNYYWTVNPPGVGWVERGTAHPIYDETSERGEADATWWHAWNTGVPADTKVTWRACTETETGLVVCSSDRVLWTPL